MLRTRLFLLKLPVSLVQNNCDASDNPTPVCWAAFGYFHTDKWITLRNMQTKPSFQINIQATVVQALFCLIHFLCWFTVKKKKKSQIKSLMEELCLIKKYVVCYNRSAHE